MINERADAIADAMREVFERTENNAIARVNALLVNQNTQSTAAKMTAARRLLERNAEESQQLINTVTDRAERHTGANLEKIKRDAEKTNRMLIKSGENYLREALHNIKLEKSIPLREAILKQTQLGIDKGLKVRYKNGRKVGYKEYMEMNVRTTVQHEIGAMQMESGKQAGIVFYIVNHFADCADDHKNYQGKMYYDARYESFGYDKEDVARIRSVIRAQKMLSIQEVREKPPYLTTRPNCRHRFTPVSIEQATGKSPRALIKDLKLSTGTYKDQKYQVLQEQRYNERQIRFFKNRMEQNQMLQEISPDPTLIRAIAKDKLLVRKWQQRQRSHLEKNPDLERDYRRETKKILLNDLGVKYNMETPVEQQSIPEPVYKDYSNQIQDGSDFLEFKEKHDKQFAYDEEYVEAEKIVHNNYVQSTGAMSLNYNLRKSKETDINQWSEIELRAFARYQETTDALDYLTRKTFQAPDDLILHRYVDDGYFSQFGVTEWGDQIDLGKLPDIENSKAVMAQIEKIRQHVSEGDVVVERGFMSASLSKDQNVFYLDNFIKIELEIPKGQPMYISNNSGESEIILPRGMEFYIKKIDIVVEDHRGEKGTYTKFLYGVKKSEK